MAALLAAGWVSVDPNRRFLTARNDDEAPSIQPFLYENDIAIAFAASIDAVREAERCFEAFCRCIGHVQAPLWDSLFGDAHCLAGVSSVELPDTSALYECVNDAEQSVVAAVVTALDLDTEVAADALASGAFFTRAPNAFDHLAALYATGTTIEEAEDEEVPFVLRLAPLPD